MTPEHALVERARAVVDEYRRRLGDSKPLEWDDPKALNHGVTVVVECIAEALVEYAREQVESLAESRAELADRLTAARQQEEEAKKACVRAEKKYKQYHDVWLERGFPERDDAPDIQGTVVYLNTQNLILTEKLAQARAENDRLTLAASESARTLQVEIADLRDRVAQAQASWHELDGAWQARCAALQAQVMALWEAIVKHHCLQYAQTWCSTHGRYHGKDLCAALPQDGA